jgi:ribosomal protein S1
VEGQVVKIDMDQSEVTVRETDGTIHEFQASKETLQEFKGGDRIEARLREVSSNCK